MFAALSQMKRQFVNSMRISLGASLGFMGFLAFVCTGFGQNAGKQVGERHALRGDMPDAKVLARPVSSLPGTNSLRLAISLPLRNSAGLSSLLRRLYDPASPDYRRYLTPAQFTERFGPTAEDYQAVIHFAESNGIAVVSTHDSRLLLDARGKVSDIERAFHATLRTYKHPTEARKFYAPETQPWVDASLPILHVAGLSDYAALRPAGRGRLTGTRAGSAGGSAPVAGDYMGQDFRNAYAPGVSLRGSGQMVGLFEADGYYAADITNYEDYNNSPAVPLQNVLIDGFSGAPGALNPEVATDIEMAIAMAPGLSAVVVFESSTNDSTWIDILDQMASSNQIKQFSSSWGYTTTNAGLDPNTSFDSIFQKMAAQGQSFFQASGDGDAWATPIWVPADSPYVTSVGGTSLTMTGPGVAYSAETVWNSGYGPPGWPIAGSGYWGSGGGVSGVYSIPYWQQGVSMALNQGSVSNRNIPDVAITATNIFITANNGQIGSYFGTSCSAPLWAGFAALVNEQAANSNKPAVGFLNPAIYALGQGQNYGLCFHDITTGSNTSGSSPSNFFAAPGYDLCTGWGTPAGSNLINILAGVYQPSITVEPESETNVTAGSVAFDVMAAGFAPLTYQWQLDGSNIAGATDTSLVVSNLVQSSAGSYSVIVNNQWGSIASSAAVLTVTQAIPTVTWAAPAPITYGALLTSDRLDATASVPGRFAYTPTNGSVLNAGTNALAVLFTPADTADYTNASNTVNLVVSPAALDVEAADTNRAYGQDNPAFTGTIIGLTNGDDITATYNCGAISNSPVGSYPIVPSLMDPNGRLTNYTLTVINGILVVGHPPESFAWTNPAPIIYGASLNSIQLNALVNVPGSYAYDPPNAAVLNTGTNTLTVIFTPTDTVNYITMSDSVKLIVLPAPLTVSGNNTNRQYGQTNPAFTGIFMGLTNGDSLAVIYSCGATAASPAGTYAIVPGSAAGTDLTNYTITYSNGILTINPAALTITADNLTKAHGQTVTFTGMEFTTSGLVNTDSVTHVTLTSAGAAATATVAGSPYAIVPSAATGTGLANYEINYVNGTLTITSAQQPVIQSAKRSGSLFTLTWTSAPVETYQVQYATNLSQSNWANLGQPIAATNSTATASDTISNLQKFYRVETLQ